MTKEKFQLLSEEKVLLLDGGTGSVLFTRGMPRGVCTEKWILENPEVETGLLKEYAQAGSDIVIAPTFGGNRYALSRFGLQDHVYDLNMRLMELAQNACGKDAFIAGDVAPTGMILQSQGGDHTIEQVFEVYEEQIRILSEAGADLIIAETMMSVDEITIAMDAASAVCDLPIMCSMSVTADGRAYYGGTIDEAAEVLEAMGAAAVGMNCSAGPDQMESLVRLISDKVNIPVIAKPNAGMPKISEQGTAVYDMGPDAFVIGMKKLLGSGAGIVGGCCGTTPEYIRKLRMLLDDIPFIC